MHWTKKNEEKINVKYLVVVLSQFLTFQDKLKKILRKLACVIKTVPLIKEPHPIKTGILLIIALVISHLSYPDMFLNGNSTSLIFSLEEQLRWAIKIFYDCVKFDSSSDLKLKHNVSPVTIFLESLLDFEKITSLTTSLQNN